MELTLASCLWNSWEDMSRRVQKFIWWGVAFPHLPQPERTATPHVGTGGGCPIRVTCAFTTKAAQRFRSPTLHLPARSLPHAHSGYALHSHGVLTAFNRTAIATPTVTLLGYQVTVGLLAKQNRDYRRNPL